MLASSFMDPVLGVDVHFEMVPTPAPVPTPIPNPFTGIIFDPIGLAAGLVISNAIGAVFGAPLQGPVLYWTAFPATNTGTEAKHVPGHILIPPGTMWAPFPKTPKPVIHPGEVPAPGLPVKPENDAICVFGSKTVTVMGSNAVRLGDILLSCSEPVRLPSSVVLAVPKGAPILIGGPPSLDIMAAVMASLRTRFVSDSLHALVSRLRPSRFRSLLHRGVCFLTGHPVDVATGRVLTDKVDAELPGPLPLRIERSYSSAWGSRSGPLGHGWSLSLDQAVWRERGKVVSLAEDGREIEFDTFDFPEHRIEPGQELWHPIERLTLRCRDGGAWEIVSHDGTTREFAPVPGRQDGRAMIRRICSRDGHHEIVFEYDRHGDLDWVRDSAGRLIGLKRDSRGRVSRLELPLPRGRGWYTHRHYEYDDDGDLVKVTDSLGHSWTFEYVTHLLVRETDRTGLSFYFAYDGLGADAWCVRTWGDGGIYDHVIAYDKKKHVTHVTDSLGHTTQYHMNLVGLVTKVVDPLGAETKYEYDPGTLQRLREVNALGYETLTEHDHRGNVARVTRPDGSVLSFVHDERDILTKAVDCQGYTWRWSHDSSGRVTGSDNPDGDSTTYSYKTGLLFARDCGGLVHRFEHTRRNELHRIIRPGGSVSEYEHDGLGRICKIHDPIGGHHEFTYDTEGRLLEVRTPAGCVHRRSYDAEGALVSHEDQNHSVRFVVTGRGWVSERLEGDIRTRFLHDTEGRLVAVHDECGRATLFQLDTCGRVAEEVQPNGSMRRYLRDRLGRVTSWFSASGAVTEQDYDAMDRPVEVRYPDGQILELSYRADGLLSSVVLGDSVVELDLDASGRVVTERQSHAGRQFSVHTSRDVTGQRSVVSSSLSLREASVRDATGEVSALHIGPIGTPDLDSIVQFQRNSAGLETARCYPGNLRVQWELDSAGRCMIRKVSSESGGNLDARHYEWRGDDQIRSIIDVERGPAYYVHDTRGAVVEAEGHGQVVRAFDSTWNVYSSPGLDDRVYDVLNRVIRIGDEERIYDDDGRLTERRLPGGETVHYAWDGVGNLVRVESARGTVHYAYDGLGRRIQKSVIGSSDGGAEEKNVTRYVWEGHRLRHEVPDHEEPVSWYYSPGTFAPVCCDRGQRRLFVVTDHNGTPTELFDTSGELVGAIRVGISGDLVEGEDVAHLCPWRFPGQYADRETGLHYNVRRYYDPLAGAYISPDPIGLAAGLNWYRYVGDPLTCSDPLGLDGHHAIPQQLVQEMRDAGILNMSDDAMRNYRGTTGPGFAHLPGGGAGTPHITAHQALTEYLGQRYPSLASGGATPMRHGFQHGPDWRNFISQAGSVDQVLRDMDRFYNHWLPSQVAAGRYPSLAGYVDDLRYAHSLEATEVRRHCT